MDYRKAFQDAIMQQQAQVDPIQKQLEAQIMAQPQNPSLRANVGLIDSLTGSRLSGALPAQESMKDKLAQLMQLKQGQQKQKLSGLGQLAQMQTQSEDKASARRLQEMLLGMRMKKAGMGGGGTAMKPNEIAKFNEGNQIPAMLKDVEGVISSNKDMFGPIHGRLGSVNPYNEKAQSMEASIRASAQSFGKFMEDGVLRAEDEVKYRKMFPNLADTPEVASNKLAIVNRLLVQKQNSLVSALKQGGYDTSPIDRGFKENAQPAILQGRGVASGYHDGMSDEEVLQMAQAQGLI
jgi:hypothetical protein